VSTLREVQIETSRVGGRPRTLVASLATPDRAPGRRSERRPGVILTHEAFGLNDDMRRIAQRFADSGYVALAPDFLAGAGPRFLCMIRFFQGVGRAGTGRPFRDLSAARAWLAARADVDPDRIGLAGFCVGGGFALLHAASVHDVRVVAPFYAHLPRDPGTLRGMCPVVASYGGRDGLLPGAGDRLASTLESFGVPHDVKTYPDAGHSFMNRRTGIVDRIARASRVHAGYVESASEDAWKRMLAFFEQHLVDAG
jgi:carboxymethylenebutenolidase